MWEYQEVCVFWILEREGGAGVENKFEKIMVEHFPNLIENNNPQIQEAQGGWTQSKPYLGIS